MLLLAAVVVASSLTGCVKLWEEARVEVTPLPETEIPVAPDPWEPGGTQEGAANE
jgi:hypothetical protein